jgi:hypothetical protein
MNQRQAIKIKMTWWRVLGELFALMGDYSDSEHPVATTNRWYRWAILKMIVPCEFPQLWEVKPANDNEPWDWYLS